MKGEDRLLLHVKDIPANDILNIESREKECSLENTIISELTSSDLAILSSIRKLSVMRDTAPSAADIMLLLENHHPLKRSHLYERLTYLKQSKLIAVDNFSHPRRYVMNYSTIARGVLALVSNYQEKVEKASRELERTRQDLENLDMNDIIELLNSKIDS